MTEKIQGSLWTKPSFYKGKGHAVANKTVYRKLILKADMQTNMKSGQKTGSYNTRIIKPKIQLENSQIKWLRSGRS